MQAAVYRGNSIVRVEEVPTPEISEGEILIRVEACGICHTDLKKIEYNLQKPPRIYGHETSGVVVSTGTGLDGRFQPGDRVVVFHHVPCGDCFYCAHKLYAQCALYKRVGVTAGFEPAGGGFSQYVRVMDWIVNRGVEKIPDGVSFEQAALVEPLNTCMKAVSQCAVKPDELALVVGQGPIGLMFTMLVSRAGATVAATDTMPSRVDLAVECGATYSWNPQVTDIALNVRELTAGRGADLVIVAASAPGLVEQAIGYSRPGARILLFAQTSDTERIEIAGSSVCVGERTIFGCYSASIDLQKESADLVFTSALPLQKLISHKVPLVKIRSGIDLALHPNEQSLKIIVQPQGGHSE
jgi:L-iditol 2-dehydrogenase